MKKNDLSASELKWLRSLQIKKYRLEHGLYLVEGKRSIADALESRSPVAVVFISESFLNDASNQNLLAVAGKAAEVRIVSDANLKKISSFNTPPGIVGTVQLPGLEFKLPEPAPGTHCLYLDRISNPGNLGSIIRTASWLGVYNVLLSPDCVDPYSPKVVQGAMGAHFKTQISTDIGYDEIISSGFHLLAATMSGTSIHALKNIPSPWILMLGSEAFGLSEKLIDSAASQISIPMLGSGESLNVSVACGILLSHLVVENS